jgi:hypothetical protein
VIPVFKLGGDERDYLKIQVLARAHPAETDYWDGNWLKAEVEIVAGPWRGGYRADLRAEEFRAFRHQLQRLYDDVDAPAAVFESMEPWLAFDVNRSDRIGHIEVHGKAQCEPFFEAHNVLFFALELDQSYLPGALSGLADIEAAFPVIGSPSDSARKFRA